VIRPFGLNDVLLVSGLQRSRASLAIEHILTHPSNPLWLALTAPWPWAGAGVATYVLNERSRGIRMAGFAQLIKRVSRPEADLLYLAPAIAIDGDEGPSGEAIWRRLLAHCSVAASGHGLQRIFASIPDEGWEQVCLKDAGFSFYTRETIYRLAPIPSSTAEPAGFRPQLPHDSWALQRLYTRSTPRLVQQAEGAITGEVGSPLLSWWEPDRWQGIVWEPAGEVRGGVQVHLGRAGHWLRFWGTNVLTARELRSLIEQGLRLIALAYRRGQTKSLPVYATVRDYEIGLGGALTGFGFAPYMNRARFVKHTTMTVREPSVPAIAALEARQEIPIHSRAHE